MAFFESPRFPQAIAMGATGGPEFSTTVIVSGGGKEQRISRWLYPKQRWDAGPGVRTNAQYLELRAFFMAARGRANGFRFKDASDFTATHADGVVVGLTSTTFQLFKRYVSGAQTLDRKIAKPVAGTVEIRVSNVVTAHTLDATTGIVTIGTAPAAANVTWSGEFDVPMRFDFDHFQASTIARGEDGLMYRFGSFPMLEVPL
jgi:uncharacterized protein (TIGR02217 family)